MFVKTLSTRYSSHERLIVNLRFFKVVRGFIIFCYTLHFCEAQIPSMAINAKKTQYGFILSKYNFIAIYLYDEPVNAHDFALWMKRVKTKYLTCEYFTYFTKHSAQDLSQMSELSLSRYVSQVCLFVKGRSSERKLPRCHFAPKGDKMGLSIHLYSFVEDRAKVLIFPWD